MSAFVFGMHWFVDKDAFDTPFIRYPYVRLEDPDRGFLFASRPNVDQSTEESTNKFLVLAYATRTVPEFVAAVLLGSLKQPEPTDESIPMEEDPIHLFKASEDGLARFPEDYQKFIRDLTVEIEGLANQTLKVFMWRSGITGGPIALRGIPLFGNSWQPASEPVDVKNSPFLSHRLPLGPILLTYPFITEGYVDIDEQLCEQAEGILRSDIQQPLYHDLLREAWVNRRNNPRSSLVMCVAAVETGMKTLVSNLQPQTDWLLERMPSPSVVLMLRELLERLPARNTFNGKVLRPTKSAITTISKGVEQRNLLVHGRASELPKGALEELLVVSRQLLYLFDFYRGQTWAREFVTGEVIDGASAVSEA